MASILKAVLLIQICLSLALSFDIDSKSNVALYWGQNSQGSQGSLASYCESTDAEIYLLSFMNGFPELGLNFANACEETFPNGLLHCSQIANDIKTCQSLGKKVFLSMGGASGSYGFTSDDEATEFAQTLWNTFGEGDSKGTDRPFDDAIVDGFDFDIENNNSQGYAVLVNRLRSLFENRSKKYYISAAPQCPYPDASVGDLLINAEVDFAFIQFYNNYCNANGNNFNWDIWTRFAEGVSPNSNIKLYLGLPGSASGAGSGYISDLGTLKSIIETISNSPNFGGISLWDASQAVSNVIDGQNYVQHIKEILKSSINTPSTTTVIPVITSSSSTSSEQATISSTLAAFSTDSSESVITAPSASAPLPSSTQKPIHSHTHSTTLLEPTSTQTTFKSQVLPSSASHSNRITTTLKPATTLSKTSATENSSVHIDTPLPPQPCTTTTSKDITKTTTVSASSPTASDDSSNSAHAMAIHLNAQYAAGQLNGKDFCTEGEIACSGNGGYAVCNFGSWVFMQCAAGTTCYAFDSLGVVYTQCNFSTLKPNFV